VIYQFGDCVLDTATRELRRGARPLPLEPQVFDLLAYLLQNRDRVVSRDDLMASIWKGRVVSESALSTRINAVRQAIGDRGDQQRWLKTLPRKGLRFAGDVREVSAPTAAPAPERPALAVLPFANLSGDAREDYFADGIAEEIITALSRCSDLLVIARNSSFTYRGRHVDVRQIGRELGVRYVLEGSVRRAGDQLRITGQLSEAATGAEIWAERFDGDAREVFDLQDRIASSVVCAIEPTVLRAEIGRLKRGPVQHVDAYNLLLRARALEYEYTDESLAHAVAALEQALVLDPGHAPAMALAAYCLAERRQQGWAKDAAAETARGMYLATRAVELSGDDPNVLWMAAFAIRVLGSDALRGRELARRSLQLNPNSALALTTAAFAETFLGRPSDALEMLKRAELLNPRDPKAWYAAAAAALAHFVAGDDDQAAACARRALAQNPRFAPTVRVLAASLARRGNTAQASKAVEDLLRIEPDLTLRKLRARMGHMEPATLDRFALALRLAGLPD
jgi:TolB-like protein/tetratricopeptide (TPR) repeat protein